MARESARSGGAGRRLQRLVRAALEGPLVPAGEEAGHVLLTRSSGAVERHGAAIVVEALARGLLARRNGRLEADPAAREFLRRQMSAREEEAFRVQHGAVEQRIVAAGDSVARVQVDALESPLGAVVRLKDRSGVPFLPVEAVAAGERLAVDFERGGLQPRVTQSWEPRLATRGDGARGGQADLADGAIAARRRVARAIDAMGPELSGVALDICCFCKGLETVERERQWPARSAKLMLKAALMALARHYSPPVRPRQRHWSSE